MDLATVSKADEPDQVTDVRTLLNRIRTFAMALENLNICAAAFPELQVLSIPAGAGTVPNTLSGPSIRS